MNIKNPHTRLVLISIVALASAYFIEYIMQIEACPLCIYQRFPYLILLFINIAALSGTNHRLYNFCSALVIVAAIIIAAYHTAIERELFEPSILCKPLVSLFNDHISVHDFKKLLYNQRVGTCNKPALVVFGLSLTEWNLSLNFILLIFCINYKTPQNAN